MYTRVKYIYRKTFCSKKILKGTWLIFDLGTLLDWVPWSQVAVI